MFLKNAALRRFQSGLMFIYILLVASQNSCFCPYLKKIIYNQPLQCILIMFVINSMGTYMLQLIQTHQTVPSLRISTQAIFLCFLYCRLLKFTNRYNNMNWVYFNNQTTQKNKNNYQGVALA